MTTYYKIFGATADRHAGASDTTYAPVRDSTAIASSATSVTAPCGQGLNAGTYLITQIFYQFDLSAIPPVSGEILDFGISSAATTGSDTLEVRQATTSANKIAGGSLGSLPLLGSVSALASVGRVRVTLSASATRSSTSLLHLSSQNERLNTAPTANTERPTLQLADQTGTTNDPFLELGDPTPWTFVGITVGGGVTTTAHTLSEPSGVAAGDLLVVSIGSRIASATQITLPAGWTRVGQQLNNNILSTTAALPSGMMAYIIRGASAPSYTFTHPVAPSIALGNVIAYRGVHQTTPLDSGVTQATTATAITAVSVAGLTTTADDDLIVALCAGGQESTWSAFNATDPGTSSGTTSASVLDPIFGQWLERYDLASTVGNDGSLATFDAVKQTAGATGNLVATASLQSGHVVVAGSFKLAPPAPTGTTYNETVAETATAAETPGATVLHQSYVRELENGVDWRETESGAIRITEGDFFIAPPIEASVAESASPADTITAALAYTSAQAETAGANETVGNTALRIGAIVESASAVDTSTGLLTRIGAIAETASAAETTDASIVPAAGIFDKMVVETAPVVDATDTLVVGTRAIAEAASAAETITKALSLTTSLAETTAAADTVGGLAVSVGAIAESTSVGRLTEAGDWRELEDGRLRGTAATIETVNGLLILSAAIVETAAAAETITYSLTGAAGTTYNEAQAEVAAAAETVAGQMIRAGAVAEVASAAETITRAVSYTKAAIETATAVETIGRTVSYTRDVTETAAAAETITAGLLGVSGAIAETAAAAETIGATVIALPKVFDVTVAESASAADTLTVDIRRWIRESPPPWTAWVEEATAATGWTKTAPASASWTREEAEGDWLLATRPVNQWTKE